MYVDIELFRNLEVPGNDEDGDEQAPPDERPPPGPRKPQAKRQARAGAKPNHDDIGENRPQKRRKVHKLSDKNIAPNNVWAGEEWLPEHPTGCVKVNFPETGMRHCLRCKSTAKMGQSGQRKFMNMPCVPNREGRLIKSRFKTEAYMLAKMPEYKALVDRFVEAHGPRLKWAGHPHLPVVCIDCGWTRVPSIEMGKSHTGTGRGAKKIGASAKVGARTFFVQWEKCQSRKSDEAKFFSLISAYNKRKRANDAAKHALEVSKIGGSVQGIFCTQCRMAMWSPGQGAIDSCRPLLMRDNCEVPGPGAKPATQVAGAPATAARWSRDVLDLQQFKQALKGEMPQGGSLD